VVGEDICNNEVIVEDTGNDVVDDELNLEELDMLDIGLGGILPMPKSIGSTLGDAGMFIVGVSFEVSSSTFSNGCPRKTHGVLLRRSSRPVSIWSEFSTGAVISLFVSSNINLNTKMVNTVSAQY
jgi:hypothetical protein